MNPSDKVRDAFEKIGVDRAKRHVFLCVGPDCCATPDGLKTWETLKSGISESGASVLRTKAACLRLCSDGPWMVVYPEGVWYGQVTPERCQRIVSEHLVGGKPVVEWAAKVHSLE